MSLVKLIDMLVNTTWWLGTFNLKDSGGMYQIQIKQTIKRTGYLVKYAAIFNDKNTGCEVEIPLRLSLDESLRESAIRCWKIYHQKDVKDRLKHESTRSKNNL